jgi:RNase H-like domain found in reverse transcriptase/Reverse transcriptase (RNA-dependent DNA polymerase)
LESFGQAKWFTTLDLASGYWQVAMHGPDIEKTAFITPFGLYEFLVMPFGLSYAPGTFQRLMNRVLQEYLGQFVAVYLDDVIIYTKGSYEQHIDHLRQVFESLRQANLKIKLKKCFFCFPNLHFLGHVVGRDGIKPDPDKIEKVKTYPEPTNLTELRSALGLFSYYRKFIRDFSKIARPMLNLLKKDAPYEWGTKQQTAFDRLKEMLTKAPILSYPDFERPFTIYTDSSGFGLGAVLSQLQSDGKEHVISYASRSMNRAEKNYPITDQECLAVIWAVKHFQHYLGLKPFTLVTDHSALKWLQTSKLPKGRRARWVMELQQYEFEIKH